LLRVALAVQNSLLHLPPDVAVGDFESREAVVRQERGERLGRQGGAAAKQEERRQQQNSHRGNGVHKTIIRKRVDYRVPGRHLSIAGWGGRGGEQNDVP